MSTAPTTENVSRSIPAPDIVKSLRYVDEQDELSGGIDKLEQAVSSYEHKQQSAEKFIALIDKYENFDTLTTTMLNEFVEKIVVHERDYKGRQDTTQKVEIYFNFVAKYAPPHFGEVSLTPEEQDALRKKRTPGQTS